MALRWRCAAPISRAWACRHFDVVSPFVGYVWTKPEDAATDEVTGTVQFGFSFNLDKALSWVQEEWMQPFPPGWS